MISAAIKTRIGLLRKKGISHRQIATQLNISSGTAFNYSKGIILSEKQKYNLKMQSALGASKKLRTIWSIKGGKTTKYRIKYTKEILLKMIRDFYFNNARIPLKREFNTHWQSYKRVFNSWNTAINEAGFESNSVIFAKKYTANDGHKCDSLSEKIIDDWLYARNINHKVHFPYPGNAGFTVDFKVNKYWLEFFGLSGELKRYDELKEKKTVLAKNLKLNLIEIYPSDLFLISKLNAILSFLITDSRKPRAQAQG